MIRLVPDTNLLASATIVKEGAPYQIIRIWLRGEVEFATSPVLLRELKEVLSRPRLQKYQWMKPEELSDLLTQLRQAAIQAPGKRRVKVISEDPDDDFVLNAALEAGADYIVSSDHYLLELGSYQGVKIITPAEFLEILKG